MHHLGAKPLRGGVLEITLGTFSFPLKRLAAKRSAAGWIVVEAAQRVAAPVEVLGWPMGAIAMADLGVNVVSVLVLRAGDKDNLNMRAAEIIRF